MPAPTASPQRPRRTHSTYVSGFSRTVVSIRRVAVAVPPANRFPPGGLRRRASAQILQEPVGRERRADLEAGVRVGLEVRQLRIHDRLRGDAALGQKLGRRQRAPPAAGSARRFPLARKRICVASRESGRASTRAHVAVALRAPHVDLARGTRSRRRLPRPCPVRARWMRVVEHRRRDRRPARAPTAAGPETCGDDGLHAGVDGGDRHDRRCRRCSIPRCRSDRDRRRARPAETTPPRDSRRPRRRCSGWCASRARAPALSATARASVVGSGSSSRRSSMPLPLKP